jgi:branched-chain amino acid aminotransferase
VIIELCRTLDIPLLERPLTVYDVVTGTEAFESSTLGEIVPLRSVDGQVIGNGAVGPVTMRVRQELRKLIASGTQSTMIFNA